MTRLLIFILIIPLLSAGTFSYAQLPNKVIVLQDEKQSYTPRQFYISSVIDERAERSYVASLIDKKDVSHSPFKVNLSGGTVISIESFLVHNLGHDTSLRPVVLAVKELKITETNLPDARIEGHLAVAFSFALKKNYGTVHLVDYHGGIRYNRPHTQPADIGAILRSGIEDGLSYFNNWINSQTGTNILLAKSVKVNLIDYSEKPEGDTIYYSVKRPLTWNDFKEKPREGRFEAEVFTSIGYTEHVAVTKGVINVTLAIKVDLAKSDCWVRSGAHDDYVLNHEQRHFDIEKLAAEHFKKKLGSINLPVDNFDGPINVAYLEALREATAMQKQYDTDTRHGQDRAAQQNYDEKIDRELSMLGLNK